MQCNIVSEQRTDLPAEKVERLGDLNIDRNAWLLIRRFGKDACSIAEIRATYCRHLGRHLSAAKWLCVHSKLLELTADTPAGKLH